MKIELILLSMKDKPALLGSSALPPLTTETFQKQIFKGYLYY
jgi:hypothetical protein